MNYSSFFSRRRFLKLSAMAAAFGGLPKLPGILSPARAATKPDKKPDKIIMRTWGEPWNTIMAAGPGRSFTEETGIPVVFDLTDENPIQTKVRSAIRAGDRPPVDIVNNTSANGYLSVRQDLIVPLSTEIVTYLGEITPEVSLPTSSLPVTDAGWPYVKVYSYTTPIVYAKDRVDPSTIKSWEDLFDPRFKGRIGVEDYYYEVTMPLAKMLGVDPRKDPKLTPVWDKLAKLKPNIGAIVNAEALSKVIASGEIDMFVALVGNAIAARDLGADVGWLVPKEGVYLASDCVYVLKNLPPETEYYAQVFVNHLLSPANQSLMTKEFGTIPVHPQATLPDFMVGDPAFPVTPEQIAKYAIITPEDLQATNQANWQAAYDRILK